MNEQNFEYLKNQLKYTGFGDELQSELREKMQKQAPDFTIMQQAEIGSQHTETMLYFKKSEQNDLYFFNRYILLLKNEQTGTTLTQSFRVGRENNITLKEGYNLMNGRAVHKEIVPKNGEAYHAWLELNFKEKDEYGDFRIKQFHQNYGYDLKQTLAKYPIKELENAESAQSLIRSLERGNRQSVTMMHEGWEQKMLIEASPRYKSLNIYDSSNLRVNGQAESRSRKRVQGEEQVKNQSQKQKAGENEERNGEYESRRQSKRRRQK